MRISTHALRMEGDYRPPRRPVPDDPISTHALRMEGDKVDQLTAELTEISTHALRMEGDN